MRKILCLCFCIFSISAQAQWRVRIDSCPLFTFLQKNFDSTVVYSPPVFSNMNKQCLWIVCKKENELTYFIYENLYKVDSYKIYPERLKNKFFRLDTAYRRTLPDTNIYFHPFVAEFQKIKEPWNTITTNNLWSLNNDYVDKVCYEYNYLMDYTFNAFYRITKTKIDGLSFGPIQLDKNCTSKPEEIMKALNIIVSFKSVFDKTYN